LETLKLTAGTTEKVAKPAETTTGKTVTSKASDDDMDDDDCDCDPDDPDCDCDDEDDDMDANASDDANNGDLPVLDEDEDDDTGKPGHLADDVDQTGGDKGSNTTVDDKVGKTVNRAVTSAREGVLRSKVQKLSSQLKASRQELQSRDEAIASLQKQVKKVSQQVQAAADQTSRRSVTLPNDVAVLLSKANVDGKEMLASGSKLSTEQSDGILAAFEASTGVKLDPVKRIQFKNQLQETGLLDDGRISRNGY
jgi:hypothetical protein